MKKTLKKTEPNYYKKIINYLKITACFVLFSFQANAQTPPANDECADAIAISVGDTISGTTIYATMDTSIAGFCDTEVDAPGVWYILNDTSGVAGNINVNTCSNISNYDTKISVYTGDCGSPPLTCVAGDDDGCGIATRSKVVFPSDGATQFYILVHGYSNQTGNFELETFYLPPAPANDNPVGATPITPSPQGTGCDTFTFTAYTAGDGTTDSGLDSTCDTEYTGLDRFYTWTATTIGLVWNGNENNPGISIRDAAYPETEIYCINGGSPIEDQVLFGWSIGNELIIQVYGFSTQDVDISFCLELYTPLPPPPNDTAAGATPIIPSPQGTGCDTYTFTNTTSNDGTTLSGLDSACTGPDPYLDRFYSWTATTENLIWYSGDGVPGISIREAVAPYNEIVCATLSGTDGIIINGWEIGDELLIQVFNFSIYPVNTSFCLELFTSSVANDNCENAIEVFVGDIIPGTTIDATIDTSSAEFCDVDITAAGVWYYLNDDSGMPSDITVTTCSGSGTADYDTKISIYTGDCSVAPLECVAGNDDACGGEQSEVVFESDGATEFSILIHGFFYETGDFTFEITRELLSVNDNELDNNTTIYPNPTSNIVTINNSSNEVLKQIQIFDINGRVIKNIDLQDNLNNIQVSMENYASGIYFVHINTQNYSTVKQVIKR
ncbi:MAG: T9SS type A sorting domain-containing protein [Flavobacteriaceae bacterium]|nr:T9SS type A sorting domain-containing protein [Flavobacteriaceae bacterium]